MSIPLYRHLVDLRKATQLTPEFRELDKSLGRASVINGDVFYSPNSKRSVSLPPRSTPSPGRDIDSLQHPLWWSPQYAHVAFIPTCEVESHPLDILIQLPTHFHRSRKGVWLDSSTILSWNRLQYDLRRVVSILAQRCHVNAFPDVIETVLVGHGPHASEWVLRKKLADGRGMFLYWIGQLAFVLAVNISIDSEPPRPTYELPEDSVDVDWEKFQSNALPKWFEYLGERSWPQTFLSTLHSCAADFAHNERVGLFIRLLQPDVHQYSVDWFLQFNVPVWYPWGKQEADSAARGSSIARLAPLPYQLQEATTMIHKTPGNAMPWNSAPPPLSVAPWLAFFERRKASAAKMMTWEKVEDRQRRIQREIQPPIANANVFEWRQDDHGVFRRTAVVKADRTEVLANYGRNQKRYDSFANEWDCVSQLGELEEDELLLQCWDDEPILYDAPPSSSSQAPDGDLSEMYTPPDPPSQDESSSKNQLVPWDIISAPVQTLSESMCIMYEHFGFVPPLQLSAIRMEPVRSTQSFKLSKVIGLTTADRDYWNSSVASFAAIFLDALGDNRLKPPADLWDLRFGNRLFLGASKRLKYLRRMGECFVFDLGSEATSDWMLCVNTASIVLLICRMDERMIESELSMELVRKAVPHHTLIRLPPRSVNMPPSPPLPIRLPCYIFTKDDYNTYREVREDLLRSTRVARAALMAGGIAWRLAVSHGFDIVHDGPTSTLSQTGAGVRYATDVSGWEYWDDACTERELDLICGAYICYHGMIYIFVPLNY